MKQYLLLFSFIVVAFTGSLNAQITITSADLPTIGLQVIRAVDDITQISPGNPGLNQVWDFTNLMATKYDTTLYLPPQGQINSQNYPGAEMAISHLNGNITPYWDYEYVRYDDQGMRYLGDEDMVTIFGAYTMAIHISCNPNPLNLQLPFTYGSSYSQQSTYEWHLASRNAGELMDSIKQISHMNIATTGDASGIMMTPYGSYQALRVKEDIISQDSVFNWTDNGWVFDRYEVNTYSHYRWYTNDFYEIGYYQIDESKGNSMTFFKSETVVGIPVIPVVKEVNIYPNPAREQITVESKAPVSGIEILDMTGKLKQISEQATNVDISALAPGIYIIRVHISSGITSSTFLKL